MKTTDSYALLVVFGELARRRYRKIAADTIYSTLIDATAWYVTHLPRGFDLGMPALFYQNGSGIRGGAFISDVGPTLANDKQVAPWLPTETYKLRLTLRDCVTYVKPLSIRELVPDFAL